MKKRKNTAPHLRLVTYLKIHRSFLLVNNEQEPTKYLWRTLNVADMTEKYPNKSKLDSTKWGPFFIDGWVCGPTLPMVISLWLVTWLADDSSMAGGESTLYGWSCLERTSLGKQTKCPQMELTAYGKGFSGSVCRVRTEICQGGRRAVHLRDWSLREKPSTVSNFWFIHWRLRKWFWPQIAS